MTRYYATQKVAFLINGSKSDIVIPETVTYNNVKYTVTEFCTNIK